jgi:hypothetical protein
MSWLWPKVIEVERCDGTSDDVDVQVVSDTNVGDVLQIQVDAMLNQEMGEQGLTASRFIAEGGQFHQVVSVVVSTNLKRESL